MATTTAKAKTLKVTLTKSVLGRPESQRKVVRALGLRKTNHTVEHIDTPVIRGMLNAVRHLLTVEEV